jgi:hypothetical protein
VGEFGIGLDSGTQQGPGAVLVAAMYRQADGVLCERKAVLVGGLPYTPDAGNRLLEVSGNAAAALY